MVFIAIWKIFFIFSMFLIELLSRASAASLYTLDNNSKIGIENKKIGS